jgi:putative cell wall-binding protein
MKKEFDVFKKTALILLILAMIMSFSVTGIQGQVYADDAEDAPTPGLRSVNPAPELIAGTATAAAKEVEDTPERQGILRNPPPIWGLDFETYTADSYPLQVVNGPLNVYVPTKGQTYVALKLKNTSSETVTAAAWGGSSYVVLSEDPYEAFTPYTVNDEDALEEHQVTGATETERESERGWYEGHDIAPGATATFWLGVSTRPNKYSDPVYTAGTYNDYIRIGAIEQYYDFIYEDGWTTVTKRREITDIYTEKIPITLTVYDPEVTAAVGDYNQSNYTVTPRNTIDIGTIDLSQMDGTWENGHKSVKIGVKNTSTAVDPHTGSVPDLIYMSDVVNTGGLVHHSYGTTAGFSQTSSQSNIQYSIGPGAIGEVGIWLNYFYMIEGTYTGEVRLNTTPARVTVNDGAVDNDPDRGIVTIPITVKLTGTNPNLPPAVTGLTATPGNSMVELNWNQLDLEDSVYYQVYRRDGAETVTNWKDLDYTLYEYVGRIHSREGTKYVDSTVENGNTYSYFVIACYANNTYDLGPYTGYPSNTASATPDGSLAIKLLAPILYSYDEPGYIELEWKLDEEDPFVTDLSGKDLIDHFNIYRNGKLYYQVDRETVVEDYYTSDYKWILHVDSEPYIKYNWQISCVAVDGTEGYLSGISECEALPPKPEIVSHQVIWTEDGDWDENDYDHWIPKDGGDILKINYDVSGYPAPDLMDIWRDGVQVASHVNFDDGWEDHDTLPEHTYTYTAVGINYYGDKTKPYTFTVTTPKRGSQEVMYRSDQYVEFHIENGTTPTIKFYRLPENSTAVYRNGVLMQSYEPADSFTEIFSDTPTEDGTYVYHLEWTYTDTGTVMKSRDYVFIRDTKPTTDSDIPKEPGTPTLTATISQYNVVLNWTPAKTGGEPKGFYIYSTIDGEYRTTNWNTFGECDGVPDEDYPKYTRDKLVRKAPNSRTYTDTHVAWQNADHEAENKWWIVAYNDYGISEPSEVVTYTGEWNEEEGGYWPPSNCADELPDAPVFSDIYMEYEENDFSEYDIYDPTTHQLNYGYIVFSWDPAKTGGEADYFRYRAVFDDYSTSGKVYAGTGDKEKLSIYIPDQLGKAIPIELWAVNGAGESQHVQTTYVVVNGPRMSVRDAAANMVEVKWCAPEEEGFVAASYRVERKNKYTGWETVVETPNSQITEADGIFTFDDTGVDKGIEYTYHVVAVGTDGVERTSMDRTVTPSGHEGYLDPPTNLTAHIVDGDVYLTWNGPTNGTVDHYEYQMKYPSNPDEWASPYYWFDGDLESALLESGHYNVDEQHSIRIRAVNDAGPSDWSNATTFKITSAQQADVETEKPHPIPLTIEEGDSQLTLRWDRVPAGTYEDEYGYPKDYGEATYYRIERTRMAGYYDVLSWNIFADVGSHPDGKYEIVDTNVINGEMYRYQVYAYNSAGGYTYGWNVMIVYGIPNGKTDADYAAEAFEALVDALPDPDDVTLDDKEAIEEVLEIYEGLTDKEKDAVSDEAKDKLQELLDALHELEVMEEYGDQIANVQALIDALPNAEDVELTDAQQIAEALEAYNNLPAEAQEYVDTDKLDEAIEALMALQKEYEDKQAAAEVEAMIYALPDPEDVTAADAEAIYAAAEAYENLTDDQKAYVSEEALDLLDEILDSLEEILPVEVENLTVLPVPDQYWTGQEIRPELTVQRVKNGETVTLEQGTDYTLAYAGNVEIGQAAITLTGQGHYTGTMTVNFNIVPADLRGWDGVAAAQISGIEDKMYNGQVQTQNPVVTFRGVTLTEDTDYTVGYRDNINVGTATVAINGKGHYTGSIEITFRIESSIDRIAGKDRFKTALDAADRLKQEMGVDKFPNIVIASGSDFPDALAGAYLAKVKDAPILLTSAGMAPTVAQYIKDNMALNGVVYILGGKGAVPLVMEDEIKKLGFTDANIQRLAGSNRYLTNIEILKAAGVTGEDLLVCSGKGYADSLSASAVGRPILLVGDSLTTAQTDFLDEVQASLSGNVYAIGGAGAVSQDAFDSVVSRMHPSGVPAGADIQRVSGKNRFLTSKAVADKFFPDGCERVVLAYAMNYPDGLAGGPVAYALGAPLLLVTNNDYAAAKEFAAAAHATRCTIMGGQTLISDEVALRIITN